MEITVADEIVASYLSRLAQAAQALPADRGAELVDEIRDHIEQARASGAAPDEAALRTLLDRLGDPDEIVAAAREGDPPGPWVPAPWPTRRPSIGLEIAAVALMTVGSIIPFVGWLLGVVLLWSSRRWTVAEKLVATLVVPGGPLTVGFVAVTFAGQTCVSTDTTTSSGGDLQQTQCTGFTLGPLGPVLLIVALVGPFVIGGVLLRRARSRADLEPPIPVSPSQGSSRWGGLEIAAVLLLSLGSLLLPVVGPAAGLVCAWASTAWSTTEKWIATAIMACGLLLPATVVVVARLS